MQKAPLATEPEYALMISFNIMKNKKPKHNTTEKNDTGETLSDVDLYDAAFRAACEIYEPMGFFPPAHGVLHYSDLNFNLLPFEDRQNETPIQYAIRSAFEAGRAVGRNNGLKEI